MKAIGYVRVSSEEQAEHGISLADQRARIEAYCIANELELVQVFEDAGISAKRSDNRPALQTALRMLSKKKADALVITKLDRLARNTIDALVIADSLDKKGLGLHSITERLDTRSAMGRFFFTLMASLAEMERRQVGERTRNALAHKRRIGQKTGGDVPFGFELVGNTLRPHPDEFPILERIRSDRLGGKRWNTIAADLNRAGIRTKYGRTWQAVQVQRALRNLRFKHTR